MGVKVVQRTGENGDRLVYGGFDRAAQHLSRAEILYAEEKRKRNEKSIELRPGVLIEMYPIDHYSMLVNRIENNGGKLTDRCRYGTNHRGTYIIECNGVRYTRIKSRVWETNIIQDGE